MRGRLIQPPMPSKKSVREDTRMMLQEASHIDIHPFCITPDRDARDYLPHMQGAARYIILDDVRQLPVKATDICRRITT